MKYIAAFLILLCSYSLSGQEHQIVQLKDSDLPEAKITRNETFDGNALWGYMNGGADVYLEYGFKDIRVQEFTIGDEKVKAEIYLMDTPGSAFGIYSIKTYKCTTSDSAHTPDCLNSYQYQAAKGPVYISVINGSGGRQARASTFRIGKAILDKIDAPQFSIPAFRDVGQDYFQQSQVKMIKGPLGLQNIVPKWIGLFDNSAAYEFYYLKLKIIDENISVADIIFPERKAMDIFINDFKNFKPRHSDKVFGLKQLTDSSVRIYEAKTLNTVIQKELKGFGFSEME
ncbi:MAG: hypothetical protein B6I19_09835 [Bacteroidetes bacterium 4572_114]|nr:MAG: hypothetical protein B6I19_09835 [Bacteroidetes bacterium 4572_114]